MDATADSRYSVELVPLAGKSFWRRMLFARVNLVGNAGAEAVANQQGEPAPTVFGGGSIVVRDLRTASMCWQAATSDLVGGTSPDQLLSDVQNDLGAMSVAGFERKYGIPSSATT